MNKTYLFFLLAALSTCVSAPITAQSFEWNSKGQTSAPAPAVQSREVNVPLGTPASAATAYDRAFNERMTGLAGIYSPNMNGGRTAYGETYLARELTASHSQLPLGTIVRVVNLDNQRTVNVRINDRGQECQDCLIMLSQAAADALGFSYRSRVSVERTGFSNWNPVPPSAPVTASPTSYGTPAPTYTAPPASGYGQPAVAQPQPYQQPSERGVLTPAYARTTPAAPAPAPTTAPSSYGQPTYQPGTQSNNYTALGGPTVMSREVQPKGATPAPTPATYSRYPATTQPQPYQQPAPTAYQPTPQPYQQPSYQQPVPQPYQQPAPTAAAPTYRAPAPQVYQQPVAAPAPTVPAYQQARSVAAPSSSSSSSTPAATVASVTPAPGTISLQIAAYVNEGYARNRVVQLKQQGMPGAYYRSFQKPGGQTINRVYTGNYSSMAEAQAAAADVSARFNISGIVVRQ